MVAKNTEPAFVSFKATLIMSAGILLINSAKTERSKRENCISNGLESYSLFVIMAAIISILLFPCKLALMASFKVKYSFEFYVLKRGHKGRFAWRQKNTKMVAILE